MASRPQPNPHSPRDRRTVFPRPTTPEILTTTPLLHPGGVWGWGSGLDATRPGVTGHRFAGGHGHRGTLPGIEPAGSPVGHEHGGNRPISTGHPNCSEEAGRRRRTEGTGNRVSVKVSEGPRAGLPVTGPPGNGGRFADQTESVWRSSRACSDRAPTLATGPQVTAVIGSGFRQRAVGHPTGTGLEKRHCPPHPSGRDGQCEVEPKASAQTQYSEAPLRGVKFWSNHLRMT
jgi:hypothetical protein